MEGSRQLSRFGATVRGDRIDVTGLKGNRILSVSRLTLKSAWKKTLDF